MTVGGFTVMFLTLFVELTGARRQRLKTALSADAYPKIDAFLSGFAAHRDWNEEMTDRLRAVGEETLLTLIQQKERGTVHAGRRLLLTAHGDGEAADLEFIAAADEANIEDQMALLSERAADTPVEQELSLRLLRHYASSVYATSNSTILTWSRSVWSRLFLDEPARSTRGSFYCVFLTLCHVPAIVMGCPQLTRL